EEQHGIVGPGEAGAGRERGHGLRSLCPPSSTRPPNTMPIMPARTPIPTRRRPPAGAQWAIGCDLGGTTLRVLARDARGRTRRLRRSTVAMGALPTVIRAAL